MHTTGRSGSQAAIARFLVRAGRALLVVAPLLLAVVALTRPAWDDSTGPGIPDHPLVLVALLPWCTMSLAIGLLLLPIGSMGLASSHDGRLEIVTVLGRRRFDLARSRAFRVHHRYQWLDWTSVLVLEGRRWAVVTESHRWPPTDIELPAGGHDATRSMGCGLVLVMLLVMLVTGAVACVLLFAGLATLSR